MSVSIPEFPEKDRNQLPSWAADTRRLQRSESFDSCPLVTFLHGTESKYDPLLDDHHRERYRYLGPKKQDGGQTPIIGIDSRTQSSRDLYEAYVRKESVVPGSETLSKTSNDGSDESSSEVGESEHSQAADVVPTLNKNLCKRCCMINIEGLSQEKGYAHSTLDVLKESAGSCKLCYFLFRWFDGQTGRWTLDRYILRLSLNLGNGSKEDFAGHSQIQLERWKRIRVGVFDTRPWQPPEPRSGGRKGARRECESAEPQQENQALGRHILCYTEEGDPAVDAGLPWLRKNVGYTGSSSSLKVANEWLKRCLAAGKVDPNTAYEVDSQVVEPRHADGYENLGSPTTFPDDRPTRLLEILPSDNSNHQRDYSVKLIKTNGLEYKYTALSYCWGEIADVKWLTKTNTIQQHLEFVDLEALPATIRDFLQITIALGVRHAWVDSLCIIQDSPSDWETESTKMGGIYRGALLTVAASRSSSSSDGCFNRNRKSSDFNPLAEFIHVDSRLSNGQTSRLYLGTSVAPWDPCTTGNDFEREVYSSPLSQRAWAFQERVFSRRSLYFTDSQLYWECDHCVLSQDNLFQWPVDRAYPVLSVSAPLSTREVIIAWYRGAVQAYSKRGLTCPDDKLVAISAVAKATYLNCGVEYVAGLWRDSIIPGLCWYRDGEGRKNMAYQCPSWSWASQLSGVTYGALNSFKEPDEGSLNMVNVLDVQVVRSENNPFGNVHSGRVRLNTRVAAGTVVPNQFRQSGPGVDYDVLDRLDYDWQVLVIPERNGRSVWYGSAVLDDEGQSCQQVVIALIAPAEDVRLTVTTGGMAEWWLILLQNAGEREQTYRRVGLGVVSESFTYCSWKPEKPNFDRDWTEQVITII